VTPSQIVELVYRALIVVGVGWLIFHIYREGEDRITSQDLVAVNKQLAANAAIEARREEARKNADAQREADSIAIMGVVRQHQQPIRLCNSSGAGALPGAPTSSPGSPTGGGRPDAGSGENLRPAVSAFELKYEGAFATCRSLLAQCSVR